MRAERKAFFFNGRKILLENPPLYAGAALLAAAGKGENLPGPGELPYLFCGNGACRDCSLHVDGTDDVVSCQLELAAGMSFRPGEGAGVENALSRNLLGLERDERESFEAELAIIGAGPAGRAALEAARRIGVRTEVFDSRGDRGGPRPVSVRGGRLAVAEDGFVRPLRAGALVLATGARHGREPAIAIAKALECRTIYDRERGYERLVVDGDGRCSIPSIFAAGDAAVIGSEGEAAESGRRAGEAAARALGSSP